MMKKRGYLQHTTPQCSAKTLSTRLAGDGVLTADDQTSDGRRCQGREHTRDQSRYSQSGDVTATARGELTKDTDLDTERSNVAESTERVCGNEETARSQSLELLALREHLESVVLVL